MILGNPLPDWQQIFDIGLSRKMGPAYGDGKKLLFAKSWMSIYTIACAIRACYHKSDITILVPDYFCYETTCSFLDTWMSIEYYPIKKDMTPDWEYVKLLIQERKIDLFIFTHYFGFYSDAINIARQLCNNAQAILIEDCAHALYAAGKLGKSGDYVIYSPHKLLPIPDGAVLVINESEKNQPINEILCADYDKLPVQSADYFWYIKKIIQRFTGVSQPTRYYMGVHFGKECLAEKKLFKMSNKSKKILLNYSYKDYKAIEYIRKQNHAIMNYIMGQISPEIGTMPNVNDYCPYVAAFSMERCVDKDFLIRDLLSRNMLVLFWPDVDIRLVENEIYQNALEMSRDVLVFPIHNQLTVHDFAKYLPMDLGTQLHDFDILLEWLDESEDSKLRYCNISNQAYLFNIPQDWDYGDAKKFVEGWSVKRGIIHYKSLEIGVVQVLIKEICGFKYIVRINRGPVLLKKFDDVIFHLKALSLIKQSLGGYKLYVVSPNIESNGKNLTVIDKVGWKCFNRFGFGSGFIDLDGHSEESLRKLLKSKWRNQLVAAEKKRLQIKKDKNRFDEILDLYEADQKKKGYKGIPRAILLSLNVISESPIEVLYLEENNEIIAFDIFYVNSNFGLYLVGWNSVRGRKMYVNNLLLFNEMKLLLDRRVRWMDLGGIDMINTEENARFKLGIKVDRYQLLGDYLWW